MNLSVLLQALGHYEVRGAVDVPIQGICYHSREAEPGFLFVAIPGSKADGRNYVHEATAKGAAAVVFEGAFFDNLRATQVRVLGARLALANLAAAFFVHPTESFYLAGITGTNGKTTLTYLIEAIGQAAGLKTGVMGTINYRFGDVRLDAGQTTPESLDLQRLFSRMRHEKVTNVSMEVSSHAAMQRRVENCHFNSCVFTNLSRDHLDFHGTMEEYYQAKEKVFTHYLALSAKKNKLAIVCTERVHGKRLVKKCESLGIPTVTYGLKKGNDLYPVRFHERPDGFEAELRSARGPIKIVSRLIGRFNLLNIMAAVMAGLHSGCEIGAIEKGIAGMPPPPGRLERIEDPKGRFIFVDYAHTPDALRSVLTELKRTGNRIITVFGCGGDRDRGKRPKMGFETARLSDICLVTSDNPRTEDPGKIIAEILPGVKKGGLRPLKKSGGYLVEIDRKKAIGRALKLAKKGDVVLIAGKGHEDYQIMGTKKIHFSDHEVIKDGIDD
ncbi:MAG: UDP-N-acetylmuramoyl-L-alanyl-D-glutamate--2,6-diaminopimelate ligase [Deltaproteobacteria bacterium]|nr:UDP-N-acetylmuramoyl-L-alanyl-D-glutamate--2,6-diaminopimelate ligase [Deltaproteobacteria bacterium]